MTSKRSDWRILALKLGMMYLRLAPFIMLALRISKASGYECDPNVDCGVADLTDCGGVHAAVVCKDFHFNGTDYDLGIVETILAQMGYGNDCTGDQPSSTHVVNAGLAQTMEEALSKESGRNVICKYTGPQAKSYGLKLWDDVCKGAPGIYASCFEQFTKNRPSANTYVHKGFLGVLPPSEIKGLILGILNEILKPTCSPIEKHASVCRIAGIATVSTAFSTVLLAGIAFSCVAGLVFCCCFAGFAYSDPIKKSIRNFPSSDFCGAVKNSMLGFFKSKEQQYKPVDDPHEEPKKQQHKPVDDSHEGGETPYQDQPTAP